MPKINLKDRIEKLLLDYVAVKSDTNSIHEKNVIGFFEKWFDEVPYFAQNKDHRGFFKIPNDYLNRVVPWALLKGEGDDTIIFIHHCDIVETKDYLTLEPLALKPYEVTEALKNGKMAISDEVKKDLDSGDWIFGRGVADMKGGGSIQLALMEEYSKDKNFKGNMLILSVPDEENLSAGMIGGAYLLKELKAKFGLNYVMTVDTEPHERKDNNTLSYYDGSIGKIMPVCYVRGKLTHVGMIFEGINPINILAEVIRQTEVNTKYMEHEGTTVSPPPTWLYHKDRKTVYDVSVPIASCGYMSVLPLKKTPKEFMEMVHADATKAFDNVIEGLNRNYEAFCKESGIEYKKLPWKTNVKYFADLYKEAVRDSGDKFLEDYKKTLEGIREKYNKGEMMTIDIANILIEKTLEYVNDLSPVIVLAMTPPYYPSVNNSYLNEAAHKATKVFEDAIAYTKSEYGKDVEVKNFYNGISDLSYAMFISDQSEIDYIGDNMLMWKDLYYIPLDIIKENSTPVFNIGPWGKDFHKYTERVYLPDLYDLIPNVTNKVVKDILGN